MVVDAFADVIDRVEGALPQVVERLDVARMETAGVPPVAVERHLVGTPRFVDESCELLALDRLAVLVVRSLEVFGRRWIHPLDSREVDRLVRSADALCHGYRLSQAGCHPTRATLPSSVAMSS